MAVTSVDVPDVGAGDLRFTNAPRHADAGRVDDAPLLIDLQSTGFSFDHLEYGRSDSGLPDIPLLDLRGESTSLSDTDRVTPAPSSSTLRFDDVTIGEEYTSLRLGSFGPTGDVSDLDTGFWGEIAFGRRIARFFAIEAATGYYDVQGSRGAEVYGMPLLINGRVSVPIAIVEPYVGAGIGAVWAHASTDVLGNKDSFAGIWDAFIGVEVGLGGVSLGAEYKYVKSGDLDSPGGLGSFNLEGNILMLTGRLPF